MLPIYFVCEDVVEVISGNKTIIIKISLHKNLLNFLIIQILSKILSNFLEFMSGDLSLN